uniref:SFRICE_019261 n=1 Tax=Spodoptera frugiperda TaxID=7108 RepID=A0A2H1WJY1_SPOFR
MRGVVVVLSCVLALAATSSVNYCGAKMCGRKNTHTFCQYPESPSERCDDYIYSGLTSEEKRAVLERINGFRNSVACGMHRSIPPAANMLKMRWVDELAREAQLWANQCVPPQRVEEHDTCRDLYSVTVGQCVASIMGDRPVKVEQLVDIWYIQSIYYNLSVSYYVPPKNGSKNYYGDFAQLFYAKSYMVGCGRSRFFAQWKGRRQRVERLVCNVAPRGPQVGHSIYTPGGPLSSCPYGWEANEAFLCNIHQKQNVVLSPKSSTTLEDILLLNTVLEIEENETLNYSGSMDEIYLTKLNSTIKPKQRREVDDSAAEFEPQAIEAENFIQDTAKTTLQLQTETSTQLTKPRQTKYEQGLDWVREPDIYDMEDADNYNAETEIIEPIEETRKTNKIFDGFVNTTNDNTTSKVLLDDKEDSGSTDVSEDPSTVDDYEDDSVSGKSTREINEEFERKERFAEPKKKKSRKVRRELVNDTVEELTTVKYVPSVEGHNPLVAVVKLIPSLADYNLNNYASDEEFKKFVAREAQGNMAGHVTCDSFSVVFNENVGVESKGAFPPEKD